MNVARLLLMLIVVFTGYSLPALASGALEGSGEDEMTLYASDTTTPTDSEGSAEGGEEEDDEEEEETEDAAE